MKKLDEDTKNTLYVLTTGFVACLLAIGTAKGLVAVIRAWGHL